VVGEDGGLLREEAGFYGKGRKGHMWDEIEGFLREGDILVMETNSHVDRNPINT
jgi:hypothetical protein